jgi:hypothetical protein
MTFKFLKTCGLIKAFYSVCVREKENGKWSSYTRLLTHMHITKNVCVFK